MKTTPYLEIVTGRPVAGKEKEAPFYLTLTIPTLWRAFMADLNSTTPKTTTEPPVAHSRVSYATRAALRAAKAALAVPFTGAKLPDGDQPFVETAEMTRARLRLEAALRGVLKAPVQASFDPDLQKAAGHLLRGLHSRDRDDFFRCEALCRTRKMLAGGRRLPPADAMGGRLLDEWKPIAALMAHSARFRDRLPRTPFAG